MLTRRETAGRVRAANRGLFAWVMARMKFTRDGPCARCRFGRNCRSASGRRFFTGLACFGLRRRDNEYLTQTLATFDKTGVTFERLSAADIARKYPQIAVDSDVFGFLEPNSGTLMARRAVEHVVADAVKRGAEYRVEFVETPAGRGRLASVRTREGEKFSADTYRICVRAVAAEGFSGIARRFDFPDAAGSFLFWLAAGRFAIFAAGVADFHRSYFGILRHAESGRARDQSGVRRSRAARRSGYAGAAGVRPKN